MIVGALTGLKENILFLRLDHGEPVLPSIVETLKSKGVSSGVILNGIGMLMDFEVGWFNVEKGAYEFQRFQEPHELISFQGNISLLNGDVFPHVHVALAGRDKRVIGGHLREGKVCNTLELFILPLREELYREDKGTFKPLSYRVIN